MHNILQAMKLGPTGETKRHIIDMGGMKNLITISLTAKGRSLHFQKSSLHYKLSRHQSHIEIREANTKGDVKISHENTKMHKLLGGQIRIGRSLRPTIQ